MELKRWALPTGLNELREQAHQQHNRWQTLVLAGAMALLMAVAAFTLWSWAGVVAAVVACAALRLLAPVVAPEMVMRLFRAVPIDPRGAPQLYDIRDWLAGRAGLPAAPDLYVIPSLALNAFSVGRPHRSAIAVTEGLLRKLELRELTAVMAHELAHIKNDDLGTLGFADMMTRVMQLLSWVAIGLAIAQVPSLFAGDFRGPWLAIVLLYLAPTLSSLLQLALSRTREYDADLDGVVLTGDPEALAAALAKIEHYQGTALEDLLPPGTRRVPAPSILRSHPKTEARLQKLRDVSLAQDDNGRVAGWRPKAPDGPFVTLAGAGPGSMRPRYRLPGLWF
jgi:heat shock protein HtpX